MSITIHSGKIFIYHLFDVADTLDLARLQAALGMGTTVARLVARRPTPQYIQFTNPPLQIALGIHSLNLSATQDRAAAVRAKFFEYGAVSIIWEMDCPRDWEELLVLTMVINESPLLERQSRQILQDLLPKLRLAMQVPHLDPLLEDYLVFYFRQFDRPLTAEELLEEHGESLARLIRGEARPLSRGEMAESLRQRISYYENDVVIIDWNTAIIVDAEESTEHLDILEFANTELLELRYYDRLLDREMDSIYQELATESPVLSGIGRHQRTSRKLMALMVDVTELTEKIENALKVIGDLYSARIYRAISSRLHLYEWKANVDEKLRIANKIYRNRLDRLNTTRFVVLEVIIIVLIAIEILLFLLPHGWLPGLK